MLRYLRHELRELDAPLAGAWLACAEHTLAEEAGIVVEQVGVDDPAGE